MLQTIKETPDTTQLRTLNEYCPSVIKDIPELLTKDGLTAEVLQSIVDTYLAHRIEPEELMCTELGEDSTAWETEVFRIYVGGVRFINELDGRDDGEILTVYGVHITDEEDERNTSFSQFDNSWWISIKEECYRRESDSFSFVVEVTNYGQETGPYLERTKLTMSLADGIWYETEYKERHLTTLTDFRIIHQEA